MRTHGALRYPPGYFSYGLDTYQKLVGHYLPFPFMRRTVTNFAHQCIARILRGCQGLHSDGWVGPSLKYMLRARGGRLIRISGSLPELPSLHGQILKISCNGVVIKDQRISSGEFSIEFEHGVTTLLPVYIEVSASKTFTPGRGDHRRLAYMLRGIQYSDDDARHDLKNSTRSMRSTFSS